MSYNHQNVGLAQIAHVDYQEVAPMERDLSHHANKEAPAGGDDETDASDIVGIGYYRFNLAATALAVIYGMLFFGMLLWNYYALNTEVLDVTWNVGDSPQTIISICLIFAAAFLWLWRGAIGKVLALLSFGYVLWQFGQWFEVTRQIKINTGREVISQAGSFSNFLLGAGWFDIITLLAVVALAGFNIYFLIRDFKYNTKPKIVETPTMERAEDNRQQAIAPF